MPRQRVRIQVEGIDELVAKLKRRSLIEEPMTQLMEDATKIGQKAGVLAVDGGIGSAVRSIYRRVSLERGGSTVMSAMPFATIKSIDKGRRKGNPPSLKALGRWASAVGYAGSLRKLRQQIDQSGTQGKFFLRAAREAVEEAMPRLRAEMERRIEAKWRR